MRSDEAIAELTGVPVRSARPIGGGDTAAAFTAELDDGRSVFTKHVPQSMPNAAAAEAASLRWLAEPDAVPVPEVLGSNEEWLVLEHVPSASASPEAAEELGRGLARLHAAGAPAHGAPPAGGPADAWIGLAPMRNEPCVDWPTFYAQFRIEPYLRRAVDTGALSRSDGEAVEEVCARLPELAGPAEPPARLHGDLWSGNVHWSRQAWLIDPAAHGGHRETDLAMLHLFGCPHLERIIAGYEQVSPLADGWRDRIGLHQLFPLLVHTVLFGAGFGRQAAAAARSALHA